MEKEYYLGLDIGTNSVGWAVTDTEYNLCQFRKKDMWGVRLFDEANTAEQRRLKRANRRRLARRKNRILLLQELFAKEIGKVDESFLIRLNESSLWLEDKSVQSKHPLFVGKLYSDIEYYKEYPTIFHLRKELIENKHPHDIRLVYLALHNILKYRGHFLIAGDLSTVKNFKDTFEQMSELIKAELEIDLNMDASKMDACKEILENKEKAKSEKEKELFKLLGEDKDTSKDQVKQICKFVVGLTGDVTKLLEINKESVSKPSFSFSEKAYDEEIRALLEDEIPEYVCILDALKMIYDWSVLSAILEDEQFISCAKVKQYELHKDNLKHLKYIIKKYCKNEYKKMFNEVDTKSKDTYSNFIGSLKKNGKKYAVVKGTSDNFYKKLDKLLETIQPFEEDLNLIHSFKAGAKNQTLFPLQRDKNNGAVPYQVHECELNEILENAAAYLPFLSEKDEKGITVAEKIKAIMTFRVPYYVGPLSERHKDLGANVWIKRRKGMENEKIYPWNYEEVIDLEKSNEAFINRMTNKCTYLLGEDVLPKNSLLYSKFMVLNELNNLKIYGEKISPKEKQAIYEDLFLKKNKVSGKNLLDYLKRQMPELTKEALSGFDDDFKTSLKSHLDFGNQVFENSFEEKDEEKIEDIIKWLTIYGDDKKLLVKVIKKSYENVFTDDELEKMKKLRYSGWGNFSSKFLNGIEACNLETGEVGTIMHFLWNTNDNLMQILSGKYTFTKQIDEINRKNFGVPKKISFANIVDDLYISPANKRSVWQTIQIAEEIKKIMGCEPKKIFVEMARGGEKEKKRTVSRQNKLTELYKKCEEEVREHWIPMIAKHNERDFQSMKLYLYYTQMGKCMYTGEKIDLESLMQGNSLWDRDHIYPQSKIKDDSIDNLVLVKKIDNAKKSNQVISAEIQKKMKGHWLYLFQKGFISKEKYNRLTKKGDFTDEELSGFINRQLVETRQASKVVADVFKNIYPSAEIVYVKGGLVSDFRKSTVHCLKSRKVNDLHHAKDAYLNIVVGNVYNTKFTSNPVQWLKTNQHKDYSLNTVFDYDVKSIQGKFVWKGLDKNAEGKRMHGTGSIKLVKATMQKNSPLYTEYSYCEKGALFDETLQKKEKATDNPLKKGLDTSKYGGYTGASSAYFTLVEFDGKKSERVRNILEVPTYIANQSEHNPDAFKEYCTEVKGLKNVKVMPVKIKKNALLSVNGFPMRIRGYNAKDILLKPNMQFKPTEKIEENIRLIEKYLEKKADFAIVSQMDKINDENMNETYDYLLHKIETVYKKRPSNQSKLLTEKKEVFYKLNLKDKVKVINEILNHVSCNATHTSNLELLGGGKNVGLISIKKNTLCKAKLVLINSSVTGLIENRKKL